MWQLDLLSHVVPAFAALAKRSIGRNKEGSPLRRAANNVYVDLDLIGNALSKSPSRKVGDLKVAKLHEMLGALESRVRRSRRFRDQLPEIRLVKIAENQKSLEQGNESPPEYRDGHPYPSLDRLKKSLREAGLGGYGECSAILGQSRDKDYVDIMKKRGFKLFHKSEERNPTERDVFLDLIRSAARHLVQVYCSNPSPAVTSYMLSRHPSDGIAQPAERVHRVLGDHWNCDCARGAAKLSLSRHRQSSPQVLEHHDDAKFEVVFPLCTRTMTVTTQLKWKEANVKVDDDFTLHLESRRVQPDLCSVISQSVTGYYSVDFLVQSENFWLLQPQEVQTQRGTNRNTAMDSLKGLLVGRISQCKLRDRIALCYILASSMLYLYPGPWTRAPWDTGNIFFPPSTDPRGLPNLASPYLSVDVKLQETGQEPMWNRPHKHPPILALGILFLQVITGKPLERSSDSDAVARWNKDHATAQDLFGTLDDSNKLSPGLKQAIQRCLKVEPTFDCSSNRLDLREEGTIRQYILRAIFHPLSDELRVGYKVDLQNLHKEVLATQIPASSRPPYAPPFAEEPLLEEPTPGDQSDTSIPGTAVPTFSDGRQFCLVGGEKEPVDRTKKRSAQDWFKKWHRPVLGRIGQPRGTFSVRIAILDSGINLSQDQKDQYDDECNFKYRSWIEDDGTEPTDEMGHGTHLTMLLRQVVPHADIHVARVYKKQPNSMEAKDAIAKALRYAVDDWKVHIVVMAFGFGEKVPSILKSIDHAAAKKVAMFAAASNDGRNRPDNIAWPARDPSVICVHSGNGMGRASDFTPEARDGNRIMVLGECVESAWPPGLKAPGDQRLMSGTSCAAPIAAGIAALVLSYASKFLTEDELEELRRTESLLKMFEKISSQDYSGYWWVKHWEWCEASRSEHTIQEEIRSFLR